MEESVVSPDDGTQSSLDDHDVIRSWRFDGLLTNGEAVRIRPVVSGDADSLFDFFCSLPKDALQHRFGGARASIDRGEIGRLASVDYAARMAFVAVAKGEIVGFAGYDRLGVGAPSAEVAFVVAEEFQHHGVATLLFEGLAAFGRRLGIVQFVAEVMGDNVDMLRVFGATGLRATYRHDADIVQVSIDLEVTREYLAACDEREAIAERASVAAFLAPRSIAVVGAGRAEDNVGHLVVQSLLDGNYPGAIFPINLVATEICGLLAYPALHEVPASIDLAIVAVPAGAVPGVIAEATALGVRAVSVITAGFAETGRSGAVVEGEMLELARASGMRIVGPNCLGVINTDPAVRLAGTFARLHPSEGRLALISQSGAVGIVLAEQAAAVGEGLSCFVSVGNKLDVSSNDVLCFLEHDPRTEVIALYLESFGNPRKFARIARRIGLQKPIVALKAGRSDSGARGARSHTAAAATPEVMVSALLERAGVIRVDRLEELLDVATLLSETKLPQGRRVALVGNSGGPLILAADACEREGLLVPELSAATRAALVDVVPAAAATSNPVDLTADGDAPILRKALEIVLDDSDVDAVVLVTTDLAALSADEARSAVVAVSAGTNKPIVVCVLGGTATREERQRVAEIPSPERCAAALAHVCSYSRWRTTTLSFDEEEQAGIAQPSVAQGIVAAHFKHDPDGGWMDLVEAAQLLRSCGLPVLETRGASDRGDAAAVADELGYPVVMKARAGALVHKSDVGAVVLGLSDRGEVLAAFDEMLARLGDQMGGAILQPMAEHGVEAIVGIAADAAFGPLVMVGLGGVLTDLLGDHAFAVPPITRSGAKLMIDELRARPLLDGYRGSLPVDRASLEDLIWRVAALAEKVPEVAELDLNPVVVTAEGALALDCKVRLTRLPPGPGPLFRALRPVVA